MPTISTLTVDVEAKTSKFSKGMKIAGAGLAAVVAGAVVAGKAASDLNESINKVGEIFGKTTPDILAFGDAAAESMGLSKTEALDAAANMGLFAQSAGLSGQAVNGFAKEMVGLSGDLASFFNVNPAEAMEDLRSGLAGQSEPLRKYGIFLTEAAVQQEAYRTGIAKTGAELTEGQKILARQSLIMQQTGKAQGDFARTSDGLANSQRIASAEFKNLLTTVGNLVLPIFQALVHALMIVVEVIQNNFGPTMQAVSRWFQDAWAKVGPFVTLIGEAAVDAFHKALKSVAPLVPKLKELWVRIQPIIKVLGILIGVLLYVALKALPPVFDAFMRIIGVIIDVQIALSKFWVFVGHIFLKVVDFFRHLPSRLKAAAGHLWDFLWSGLESAINQVINGLNYLIGAINRALEINVDMPGPLPDVNVNAPDIPSIPTLATGGLVKRTGFALVHEGERFSGVGGGWGGTVNVYVQGSVQTEKDLADTIQKTLLRSKRRSGSLGLS